MQCRNKCAAEFKWGTRSMSSTKDFALYVWSLCYCFCIWLSVLKKSHWCCRSITRAYYRNSVGGLLLFDITNRRSFQNVHDWLEEARSHVQPHSIVFLLVGHKCDLEAERQVCPCKSNSVLLLIAAVPKHGRILKFSKVCCSKNSPFVHI